MSFNKGFQEALKEVQEKDEKQIERESAEKWADKAKAVFHLASLAKNSKERCRLLNWGDDLKHEALEHSSLVEDEGKTVGKIQRAIFAYRDKVKL